MTRTTLIADKVKDRLGIRYTAARMLTQQAQNEVDNQTDANREMLSKATRRNVDATATMTATHLNEEEERILHRVVEIFHSLPKSKQEEMLVVELENDTHQKNEPDWQRRAREQALKREQEWEEAAEARKQELERQERERAATNVRTEGNVTRIEPTETIAGPKRVTTTTKRIQHENGEEEIVEIVTQERMEDNKIKYTKVTCCSIL